MTDIWFYVVQVIYFTCAATLFGIFANYLRKEVQQSGWGLTPKLIRSICLVCSSTGYLMIHLDTFGALGIYSDAWQYFVSHITASMLVGSVCASLYMYVLISFKGESVPLFVIRLWVASNVGGFLIVLVASIILVSTDIIFWSFICSSTLMMQEILLYFGFLIIVYKTTQLLSTMTQTTDYGAQIRKLWKSWFFASCVIAVALANQSLQLRGKAKWAPVPVTNHELFEARMILGDLIFLAGHLVLLFMLRPPTKSKGLFSMTRIRLETDSKGSTSSPTSGSTCSPTSNTDTLSSREMSSKSSQVELCVTVNN